MVRVIVRAICVGLLVGGSLMGAPQAAARPETCPPTCDSIPATAWPVGSGIPLDSVYHWPALAELAVPAPAPRFRFEELCATPQLPNNPRSYAVAEKALVSQPDGQWQLQAQVIHWRGDTSTGGQLAQSVFNGATVGLRLCQLIEPQFTVSLTTDRPDRMAAVFTGPVVVHQYLLAHPQSSTVSELVLWTTPRVGAPPEVPWPAVPDAQVFDAMAQPLCGAYLASCG
ncbi:hypothetical protein BH09ACT7_BH09ACT7_41660 [soil metagenome]